MSKKKSMWIVGAVVTLAIIVLAIALFLPKQISMADNPRAHMPQHPTHTDHTVTALKGPFESGEEVTQACLECHPEAGEQMLHSSHFTWEHGPYDLKGHDEPVYTGKKHVINNFCIGITPNWPPCTACHAGYGWDDQNFDFTDPTNVDCLVCHDTTGAYIKQNSGYPADGVDLAAVAQQVGLPSRENCGGCHFNGGGGDAVKHGDLDTSLTHPKDDLDVHMGRYDFVCVDCHRTEDHEIGGRSISVSLDTENQIACTDCHLETPHQDERINVHTANVACQTCHIPEFARKKATKVEWDWSKAGLNVDGKPIKEFGGKPLSEYGHPIDGVTGELDMSVKVHDYIAKKGFDNSKYFSSYLHTLRWNCVTSTNPKLFQFPYRAGIQIKAYQLLPLRKALLMPRVNLL